MGEMENFYNLTKTIFKDNQGLDSAEVAQVKKLMLAVADAMREIQEVHRNDVEAARTLEWIRLLVSCGGVGLVLAAVYFLFKWLWAFITICWRCWMGGPTDHNNNTDHDSDDDDPPPPGGRGPPPGGSGGPPPPPDDWIPPGQRNRSVMLNVLSEDDDTDPGGDYANVRSNRVIVDQPAGEMVQGQVMGLSGGYVRVENRRKHGEPMSAEEKAYRRDLKRLHESILQGPPPTVHLSRQVWPTGNERFSSDEYSKPWDEEERRRRGEIVPTIRGEVIVDHGRTDRIQLPPRLVRQPGAQRSRRANISSDEQPSGTRTKTTNSDQAQKYESLLLKTKARLNSSLDTLRKRYQFATSDSDASTRSRREAVPKANKKKRAL